MSPLQGPESLTDEEVEGLWKLKDWRCVVGHSPAQDPKIEKEKKKRHETRRKLLRKDVGRGGRGSC